MIYTYGLVETYDPYIAEKKLVGEYAKKIGIREKLETPDGDIRYEGGAVWETAEEALAFLDKNKSDLVGYAVYCLEGDWIDIHLYENLHFHRLINDRKILGRYSL